MTTGNRISNGFWCGFIIHALIMLTVQDWLGLEDYLRVVVQNWVDIPWILWPVLAMPVFWWYSKQFKSTKKESV